MDNFASIFDSIVQVIGVAYTYQPSLSMRKHLTRNTIASHSSKTSDFSYFYKGDRFTIAKHNEPLFLREDPFTGNLAQHWAEPELAVLLGERHQLAAYTLANDLTAITLEIRGRTETTDGTLLGKVWSGSGSLGPRFISSDLIADSSNLEIGLRVERRGTTVYDRTYNTSRRLRNFEEIPGLIVSYSRYFNGSPPPSKKISFDPDGFLPSGTVIMLGTGLIVRDEYYCKPDDLLTVYSDRIGELTNTIKIASE